jgi:dodecin
LKKRYNNAKFDHDCRIRSPCLFIFTPAIKRSSNVQTAFLQRYYLKLSFVCFLRAAPYHRQSTPDSDLRALILSMGGGVFNILAGHAKPARKVCQFTSPSKERRRGMSSIYKVIEIIGGSEKSWEDAAKKAVETAAKSLMEIRVAEVKELDMRVEDGKVVEYRVKMRVSFKYVP